MAPENADGLSDGVVRHLELAVTVGLFGDGERLPTEVKLAEMLGVSTVTLRQGLAKLRERGLIETRRGRGGGSYVCDAQSVNADNAFERLRSTSIEELRDLGDACAAIVGMSARLAAVRALGPEVDRLSEKASAFVEAETPAARRRADSRFHIEIAVIGQSVRLADSLVQLLGEFASMRWDPDDSEQTEQTAAEHLAIIAAIRSRDADKAQKLAQDHLMREARVMIDLHMRIVGSHT